MKRIPGACRAILSFLLLSCAGAALAAPNVPAPADARKLSLSLRLHAAEPGLLWLSEGPERARLALRLLRKAGEHGLDAASYGAEELERRLDSERNPAATAALDRDISSATLHYLAELRFGRVASGYRPDTGAVADFDPVEHLRQALREGGLEQAVESAAPPIPLYGRVKSTLAHYRELARAVPHWPALPPAGPSGAASGTPYAGTALLCERLRWLGDLAAGETLACGDRHGAALDGALRRFQARHGLAQDGVLGPGTLAALAIPPGRRVTQLALTLERLRWLPPQPRGRIVAVNVPTYRLWAFDSTDGNAAPVLEMPVIVGTAVRTPTPLFIGQMLYLEFNPYWNVPPSILSNEIIPKLARHPGYLQQNDMEVVAVDGRVLRLSPDAALGILRRGEARVRQRPGERNVLGEVKFAMPNPMNIYLHSTSSKGLFNRTRRDLNHGCIRVERPAELAQFVLADPQRWDAAAVAAAMAPGDMRIVRLAKPVPVVLFYATALVDRDGKALFAPDIYRQDDALAQQLAMMTRPSKQSRLP
ncbi:L,D-transpeptidase family protein [Massilia varians]|uniref:L,D-transpeptidase family protein n=1 Tax=Massilia varians TaxID=457921 RepID=UPI002556E86B|nr:L,D-transpeptidase family protein [Massilia varians]MDK6077430.1 L,D-transpeptidase family protein [Massilia varians]